jgi:hypothetical protein
LNVHRISFGTTILLGPSDDGVSVHLEFHILGTSRNIF